MLRCISLLCLSFTVSVPTLISATLADEIYTQQVQKATGQKTTTAGNKSYRKKGGKDVKKPSASSGENKGRRFKGEETDKKRKKATAEDSDVILGDNAILSDSILPIANDENEGLKFQKPEFQEWEIRPMTLDEKALTDVEIQMVKDHYENNAKNEGRPHLQMISAPK